MLEYNKEYNKLNRNKITKHKPNRRNTNPIYSLIKNNRKRIHKALQSNSKTTNTIKLLGCSKKFFYNWIKWQLPYDMSDDEFKKAYHIEHVRPISSFNLSDSASQNDAFNWTYT